MEADWAGEEGAVEVWEAEAVGLWEAEAVGLGEAAKVAAEERTRLWGANRRNLKACPAGQTFVRSQKLWNSFAIAASHSG